MESKRKGIVDLWRLVACFLIVSSHLDFCGLEVGYYPLSAARIFVEFFLILTGYFTALHFEKCDSNSLDEISKCSIEYTMKKFIVFWPYVVIGVCAEYIIEFLSKDYTDIISHFANLPFEILLLTESFNPNAPIYNGGTHLSPIWFLSAMFIVFPLFCCICQIKAKSFLYILSFGFPVHFYGYAILSGIYGYPLSVLRVLAGLMLGVFVRGNVIQMNKLSVSKYQKIVLTIIEEASLLFSILACWRNWNCNRIIVLGFVISLSIMLSNQSITKNLSGRIFECCGKISMVIYIFHGVVGTMMGSFFQNIELRYRIIIYYVLTMSVSTIMLILVERKRYKVSTFLKNKVLK